MEQRKGKVVSKEVVIELTEQQMTERREKSSELDLERAGICEVLAKELDAWKLRKGELRKQIDDLEAERLRLNTEAEDGKATVTDDVLAVTNQEVGQMEYYYPARPKKGEEQKIVASRTLEPDERQLRLLEEEAASVGETGQEVEGEE